MDNDYTTFFQLAMGFEPFPWQKRFAVSEEFPELLSIPTGMGKTAGVILGWLWRRRFDCRTAGEGFPRRLVYCLPMRVLVEQTESLISGWLGSLGYLSKRSGDDGVALVRIMGGDSPGGWDVHPEQDCIIVGTQDMLLSRALNRGYGMSRYRWPVHFGLLNNDCLWVIDEVQLMGVGLSTSAQLQAFRDRFDTVGRTRTVWMSATLRREWINTVDFRSEGAILEPGDDDWDTPVLARMVNSEKRLERAEFTPDKTGKTEASHLYEHHRPGTRTLCIVNTVRRAQAVFEALRKLKPDAELVLLHSRFRPGDRQASVDRMLAKPGDAGTICVSTQVIEAGVDVSSALLVTDMAPWSSMVQRFGRCNRRGEYPEATIFWIPIDPEDRTGRMPYTRDQMEDTQRVLDGLHDGTIRNLPDVSHLIEIQDIPRRRDILELFDTTPDLAGADIDISRFIRESDDRDLQVFWRELDGTPDDDMDGPSSEELCRVSISDAVAFLKKHDGWLWDALDGRWRRVSVPDLRPGVLLLLSSGDGGYTPELGWSGTGRRSVTPISSATATPEFNDGDPRTEAPLETIAEHTDRVVRVMDCILQSTPGLDPPVGAALREATRWHDAGKAHQVFQEALGHRAGDAIAKAPGMSPYTRRGFRHELGSGLTVMLTGGDDLVAYLSAAHHGKVRLSIRSLPNETPPADTGTRFARGIHEDDVLPETDLGGGVTMPETRLSLDVMEIGHGPDGPSWLARMLRLRDDLGPFRLGYLEALVKAADERGSIAGKEVGQ